MYIFYATPKTFSLTIRINLPYKFCSSGLCTTAAFYGDKHVLHIQQISDIVGRIYDSITRVTFENVDDNSIQQKDLSYNEFVKALLQQREIQDIVVLPLPPRKLRMKKTKRTKKSVNAVDKTPKASPIYDFGNVRDDESSVRIHMPPSPKSPKNKNTNKYMPLIDEIEQDARNANQSGPISSSSSSDNDIINPDIINVTTTEEEDTNDDDNSLQEDDNFKDDAILTTLKANSKVASSLTKSLKQQNMTKNNNTIHLYSMADSDTNISPASQSVLSTDLSSHMSSVMLKPLARVRLEYP